MIDNTQAQQLSGLYEIKLIQGTNYYHKQSTFLIPFDD